MHVYEFTALGLVATQMQAPPTTPRGGAPGDAATPPAQPAQPFQAPKPRAAATKRRPSPPLLETPAKRTRGAAPATTTEEKLIGDADDARAQARQKFAAQDFVGAAALFAEHAAACRDPKDASKARADESAAWLSAGVAEPA